MDQNRRSRRRRSPWRWRLLGAAVVASLLLLYYRFYLKPELKVASFTSCRNHVSFVAHALNAYVGRHGQLPHEPGVPGEELVCRLNVQGASGNCQAGAPGQDIGGWQLLNASKRSWDEILRTMKGKQIPVLWCGKPHRPGGQWAGTVRVVIVIDQKFEDFQSFDELVQRGSTKGADGRVTFGYFLPGIVLPEDVLAERLAEENAILRKNGEPETPIDIEGGRDYERIGKPYQNPPTGH